MSLLCFVLQAGVRTDRQTDRPRGITRDTGKTRRSGTPIFQCSLEEGPCPALAQRAANQLWKPAGTGISQCSALSSRAWGRNSPLFALHRAQQCQECHTPRCRDTGPLPGHSSLQGRTGNVSGTDTETSLPHQPQGAEQGNRESKSANLCPSMGHRAGPAGLTVL